MLHTVRTPAACFLALLGASAWVLAEDTPNPTPPVSAACLRGCPGVTPTPTPGTGGDLVTIPTAASIVGGAPFYSDVRLFNTSYDSTISLEAHYRCYEGTCPAQAPSLAIDIAPRETKSFNDIVAGAFRAPNSAGGIEFEVIAGGTAADVGITSRLYSTAPIPTVGMFVPGVVTTGARPVTFLGQIANGGSGLGFRTNAGAFNGGDAAVTARFDVFNARGEILGTVTREISAHSGSQINNIFATIHRGSDTIDDAVIVVTSTGDVFSYAAVIDNETNDPFLVMGIEDVAAPPDYKPAPAPTSTRANPPPTASPTPTQTPPSSRTPTITPTATRRRRRRRRRRRGDRITMSFS